MYALHSLGVESHYRVLVCSPCNRIECYDKRWWKFAPVAGIVGAGYAVGLPILFLYLVRRFKNQILAGDKVVEHALGPVAVPRNT